MHQWNKKKMKKTYDVNNITKNTLHRLLLSIRKKDCEIRELQNENVCIFQEFHVLKDTMKENLESDESEIRCLEKELHKRKEIEEILESASEAKIPSCETIEKMHEIIEITKLSRNIKMKIGN